MIELGIYGHIHDYRMPSVHAARQIDHADFVFIDADHSADAVAADAEAWASKAAVLCGHDYSQAGVREGLTRVFGPEGVGWYPLPIMDCWTTYKPLADEWLELVYRGGFPCPENNLLAVPNPDGSARWSVYDPQRETYVPGAINVSRQEADTIIKSMEATRREQPTPATARDEL